MVGMELRLPDPRTKIRADMDALVGAHDEPEIYATPLGDPGLIGPGSMSWELHSDMGVVAAAGIGAIIMEILHPAVMAGVSTQSTFRTQPERRMRTTFGYVVATTFGSTDAATALIGRVRRMHERVNGTMPDGRPYRAMDPELIAWVHNAIPWAIMNAYDTYHRPLTTAEKDRYLKEQSVIGRMSGANDVPESVAELDEFVEAMRPKLAVNEQTVEFLDFVAGPREGKYAANDLERFQRRLAMKASMALLPEWSQKLTSLEHSELGRRLWFDPTTRLNVRLLRWAYGVPACRRLAEARAAGVSTPVDGATDEAVSAA